MVTSHEAIQYGLGRIRGPFASMEYSVDCPDHFGHKQRATLTFSRFWFCAVLFR
jgi:hypothetical protein